MKRPVGFDKAVIAPPEKPVKKAFRGKDAPRSITVSDQIRPSVRSSITGWVSKGDSPEAEVSDRAVAERRARADLARAARKRRRYERAERRRFTRRSRRRRITWMVTVGIVIVMLGLVAVAVFSPLLALREIRVDGTARLSAPAIAAAIDGQKGTPLALIDMKRMTDELAKFPLIRSFVTETIPPDTLAIHIVERQPIGSISSPGGYSLVDPAGVEIEKSTERIAGVPLIDTGGAGASSPAFTAAVEVLVVMPESVLSQLDTISARTRDDVTITLASSGTRIVWGSADNSVYKARVLAAALAKNFPGVTEYNVSAPGQLTYR